MLWPYIKLFGEKLILSEKTYEVDANCEDEAMRYLLQRQWDKIEPIGAVNKAHIEYEVVNIL